MNKQVFAGGAAPEKNSAKHADVDTKAKHKYRDPLTQWPIRGLAYTNEIGAALSEVAPTFGLMLWIPALLYFGADIYDKYKNDKDSYNPNGVRGTEQAAFQALASVILPTASVKIGQRIGSLIGKVTGKNGLTFQTEEEIIKFLQSHLGRRNMSDHISDIDEFKEAFHLALENKNKNTSVGMRLSNIFHKIGKMFISSRHPEAVASASKDKVSNFANKQIDEIFAICKQLIEDDSQKPAQMSKKMFKQYHNIKLNFGENVAYKDTAKVDAINHILKKHLASKVNNAKIIKTIGGFVALGLAIKPIDKFVENVVIKKYISPGLHYMQNNMFGDEKAKTLDSMIHGQDKSLDKTPKLTPATNLNPQKPKPVSA